MVLYIENFLKFEKVLWLFEDIKDGNVMFYKNVLKDIFKMVV